MADKKLGSILGKCCKHECLPAVPSDDQYVLVRVKSDWYLDETKDEMVSWEKIESALSDKLTTPISRYKLQTAGCRPGTKCRLQTGYKRQPENKDCFSFDT